MEHNFVVMNMSGIYEAGDGRDSSVLLREGDGLHCSLKTEGLPRDGSRGEPGIRILDLRQLPGTNCYLDPAAKEAIREKLCGLPPEGIHLLDSGNYHYLSLLWMEKIKKDFALVLFDNHPDMQAPSFGEITSCGGWVREALLTLPHLRRVYLIGADDALVEEELAELSAEPAFRTETGGEERESPDLTEKLRILSPRGTVTPERMSDVLRAETLPLYLSVDKDVLSEKDAVCNWSQGTMRLRELCVLLQILKDRGSVMALDICGEAGEDNDGEALVKNRRATEGILDIFLAKSLILR